MKNISINKYFNYSGATTLNLGALSVKKYGKRPNELPKKLDQLFKQLAPLLPERGHIDSDEHKLYPDVVKKYLPRWQHHQLASIRASVAGQGELKRLFRRTWCTTKSLERLEHHLWIYIGFHNKYLTQN